MRINQQDRRELETISKSEFARFETFLESHPLKKITWDGGGLSYLVSGEGKRCVLLLAGGWGGPELGYETVLGLEGGSRVLSVDVSGFADPKELTEAVDRVLDAESIHRVVLVGQSMGGILGQVYFRENPDRVEGMVLINTIAPRPERCKKWALVLLRAMPFRIFKLLAKKSLSRLGRYEADISPEMEERLRFKRAFVSFVFNRFVSKAQITNALELAYHLNGRGGYTSDELSHWTGRLHLITSEDDPYFPDIELFQKAFPQISLFHLPKGYGHIAPQVFRDEFFVEIRRFIDSLDEEA